MLAALRAFAAGRARPGLVREVRTAHAVHVAALAERLAERAPTDDSRAAGRRFDRLAPGLAAALTWALPDQPRVALSLARSAGVLREHYGGDALTLAALTLAARSPDLRAASTSEDLAVIGVSLCVGDLDLVDELARLARQRANSPRDELAAAHLSGVADAYRGAGRSALTHRAVAERLALELGDVATLASVQQGQGLAYRRRDTLDPDAALTAFARSLDSYARAGDAVYVNNVRYMMAMTALDAGRPTAEAIARAEACVEYARRTGNRHELAHALLVRGGLLGGRRREPDLREALERFVAVGDLRCLVRCHLRLADLEPPTARVGLLERAADIAAAAHDDDRRVTVLHRLIEARAAIGDIARGRARALRTPRR
jgi:hypothetical protein